MSRDLKDLESREISSQDQEKEDVYKNHGRNGSSLRKRRPQVKTSRSSHVPPRPTRQRPRKQALNRQNTDPEESEYHPTSASSSSSSSERDDEELEEQSVDHLLEKTIQHLDHTFERQEDKKEEEEEEEEEEEDTIEFDEEEDSFYWKNVQEKKKWIQQYQQANAHWIQQYGCRIDSDARPEATQRLRKETKQHTLLRMILFTIILVYSFQLYTQHYAQWNLQKLVPEVVNTWFSTSTSNHKSSTNQTQQVNKLPQAIKAPAPVVQSPITGSSPVSVNKKESTSTSTSNTEVDICSDFVLQFFKSKLQDEQLKLSTLQACEVAINKSTPKSLAWVEANVLRGDMFSLLRHFEKADQDYNKATTGSFKNSILSREIQMKIMSNRWIRLFTEKKYTQIQQECTSIAFSTQFSKPLQQLAHNWLQVFEKQKPLKEVLTQSRAYTLKRILY